LWRRKAEQERRGKCEEDKYVLTERDKKIIMCMLMVKKYK
jgi:hypothetical protein